MIELVQYQHCMTIHLLSFACSLPCDSDRGHGTIKCENSHYLNPFSLIEICQNSLVVTIIIKIIYYFEKPENTTLFHFML
jgi:hypothetical protein